MRDSGTRAIAGMFGAAVVVVALGLLVGGAAGQSMSTGASGLTAGVGATSPLAKTVNTSGYWNFSSPHPTWHTGNLCTPVTSGSTMTCTYNGADHRASAYSSTQGQCGCQTQGALTYNFSNSNINWVVDISNVQSQPIYLNFVGHNDTIVINITGCKGATLNVSVLSQITLTLNGQANHIKAWIYLYSDADHYIGNISGSGTSVWTYFVSSQPKYYECPANNNTHTDSYLLNVTGWGDLQSLVFVNGVGYNTSTNTIDTGSWNQVSFENTTDFVCEWSWAPAPTCHHGSGGWVTEGVAVRKPE